MYGQLSPQDGDDVMLDVAMFAGGIFFKAGKAGVPGKMCFPPGTLILMGDGRSKPIEQIVVGDYVMIAAGTAHEVTRTFHNWTDTLYRVTFRW